mmetsp:Transcript_16380/g.41340  ORF Transcript_16380/g.41340 Transcript_16380/m.41340 type:complete len:432 (+) Transcript_16380:115-1410(+)
MRALAALSLLMLTLDAASAFLTPTPSLLPLRALHSHLPHRPAVPARPAPQRAGSARMAMQWKDAGDDPADERWKSFSVYNFGRWKGRTLHISPETGEYIAPFSKDHLVDVLDMDKGVRSAKMRTIVGEDTAPSMTECVITANEDFHIAADGSYSRDQTFAEVTDVEGAFRFCIEMSLSVSMHERVRFQALYDFESKLSRIVVYEEYRVISTGASRLIGIKLDEDDLKGNSAIRSPLTMLSLVGEFRGDAQGSRSSRLGGGELKTKTRSGVQWDGKTIRREFEVVDERLRSARKVQFGDMGGNVVDVLSLEDGYKLLLLPSGCFCCLPERLEPEISKERGEEGGGEQAAPEGDMAKLEAMMNGFSVDDDVVKLKAFTAEFGCYTGKKERKRMVRMYNTDGTMMTTTMVTEKRSGGKEAAGEGKGSALYDEFE